jgi:hypothetical protein
MTTGARQVQPRVGGCEGHWRRESGISGRVLQAQRQAALVQEQDGGQTQNHFIPLFIFSAAFFFFLIFFFLTASAGVLQL